MLPNGVMSRSTRTGHINTESMPKLLDELTTAGFCQATNAHSDRVSSLTADLDRNFVDKNRLPAF